MTDRQPAPLDDAPPKQGRRRLDLVGVVFDMIDLLVVVLFVITALWFVSFKLRASR
jgi:hypothetical protein